MAWVKLAARMRRAYCWIYRTAKVSRAMMLFAKPPALSQTIVAPRIFDGEQWLGRSAIVIENGRIGRIESTEALPDGACVVPDGAMVAAGLIDLQVNGGGGVLLNDAPHAASVRAMLAAHRAQGTVCFLPTLITDHPKKLQDLAAAAAEIASIPGVLGLHLEGPFLNLATKGVHPVEFIRAPLAGDLAAIFAMAQVLPVLVTLAPECVPPGLIRRFAAAGIKVSIGHSNATAEQVLAACVEGATGVTHLYNAMSQLAGRAPGVVGTAFDDARLTAGIIVDGLHVTPANLRTAFKVIGRDRLALVTDAMPTVGSTSPTFGLQGRAITLIDGKLTAPDGGFAGAHLGMLEAVRNATTMMGAPLGCALVMASRTPACFLGLAASHGRIAPGYAADLIAFTDDFRPLSTWIGGRPV